MVKGFRELEIYQSSLPIAEKIYKLAEKFPKDETYGLADQLRRASASIGANITEGFGRFHYKDKLLFFYDSRGFAYETMHFIELSSRIGYINDEDRSNLIEALNKLSVRINNFINSIGHNG